ncbi:hypothetical protein COV17_01750 [Candidatus Woesearchaeota archaeon CG10_big_fil_rev_8_21_14_0_10_36_11]|nr:MAG: hypothetical protein COV17_01750 [Candidatus Woesearchaeota archaeon CG10_big_fil_rev_8_21_14_0_10_36_11]
MDINVLEQVVCVEIRNTRAKRFTEEMISIARAISTITGIFVNDSECIKNINTKSKSKKNNILNVLNELQEIHKEILDRNSIHNSQKKIILETEIEDANDETEDCTENSDDNSKITISHVTYSFEDEEFAVGRLRTDASLDYIKLWYGETQRKGTFTSEPDYETESFSVDETSEVITENDAKKTLIQIQYATVFGSALEVSSIERRKFDMWVKFNSSLFGMFEKLYAVTNDVNYSPLT